MVVNFVGRRKIKSTHLFPGVHDVSVTVRLIFRGAGSSLTNSTAQGKVIKGISEKIKNSNSGHYIQHTQGSTM